MLLDLKNINFRLSHAIHEVIQDPIVLHKKTFRANGKKISSNKKTVGHRFVEKNTYTVEMHKTHYRAYYDD